MKTMSSQEVIRELKRLKSGRPTTDYHKRDEAIEVAKDAVDKHRTPKKPIDAGKLNHPITIGRGTFGKGTHIIYKCPVCDNWVNSVNRDNYCPKCGQALDWSETE